MIKPSWPQFSLLKVENTKAMLYFSSYTECTQERTQEEEATTFGGLYTNLKLKVTAANAVTQFSSSTNFLF
jgi:hypothetical protein